MSDDKTTVLEIRKLLAKFRDQRNWRKNHNAKNLAVSIVLEAAELLENFQWLEEYPSEDRQKLVDELSDIMIYCFFLADELDIDISQSILSKMDKNNVKYPAHKFKSHDLKSKQYRKVKQNHRKNYQNT